MQDSQNLDLRLQLQLWIKRKWLIAGIAAVFVALFTTFAQLQDNVYRSEVLIAANSGDRLGGASRLALQYSVLASLAGINLTGDSSNRLHYGLETLKSRRFIVDFIHRRGLEPALIATDHWDSSSGQLVIDTNAYDVENANWIREVSWPLTQIPSDEELYERFREILDIGMDDTTGFVRVSVKHESPELAASWAGWLIEDLNRLAIQEDVQQVEQAIKYLREQAGGTSVAELRSVFYRLIEEEMKTVVLARATDEYLFNVLDPAVAPQKHYSPNRPLLVILGLIAGLLIGVLWVSFSKLLNDFSGSG